MARGTHGCKTRSGICFQLQLKSLDFATTSTDLNLVSLSNKFSLKQAEVDLFHSDYVTSIASWLGTFCCEPKKLAMYICL